MDASASTASVVGEDRDVLSVAASPGGWTAHWISASAQPSAVHTFQRVVFRHAVTLDSVPAELPIRISADSRYVLWVNGREIGRGPIRSQPSRWTYDEYDLAKSLVSGTNELAVIVTYYGEDNAIWHRARVSAGLGTDATLIFEADEAHPDFATGPNWKAERTTAWSNVPSAGILAALPLETVDLRRLSDDWTTSVATRENMPHAEVASATHLGSHRRSSPPVHPYGRLSPRPIAMLGGSLEVPRSSSFVTMATPTQSFADPSTTVRAAWSRTGASQAATEPPRHPLVARSGHSYLWQFDFGRVVAGFVNLDIEAPEGTIVDIAYLERPLTGQREERHTPRAGVRIVTRDGVNEFRALEWNGLRYAAVLVTPVAEGSVELRSLSVQEHLYPFDGDAAFHSSDPDLERLWAAGLRTVQLNSLDAFTDCPTREQRAWVGDPVVHAEVHLIANSDWRLVERHLELADSPRADGLLPMAVAGDIEASGGFTIPDWSLHWLHCLWLYARSARRREAVASRLASAQRILAWFEQYADPTGVLTDVPEWTLGDWSSVFTDRSSAILTGLWARGQREFAELSEWIGDFGAAARARQHYQRTHDGFERFWDPQRGLYVDQIVGDRRNPAASQATNAIAIAAGLAGQDRAAQLIARVTDESRLVTRGWNVGSPHVSLEQKLADRTQGRRQVDWDPESEIVRAEPFFASVVHDAVATAGRADLLPELIKRWLAFLNDGYDTFGECWEWGTPCHGWSSTPARDLVVHILGVAPGDLSQGAYRVAPARVDIASLSATVPTREGAMHIAREGQLLTLRTPIDVEVVRWRGGPILISPGTHVVDLEGED